MQLGLGGAVALSGNAGQVSQPFGEMVLCDNLPVGQYCPQKDVVADYPP